MPETEPTLRLPNFILSAESVRQIQEWLRSQEETSVQPQNIDRRCIVRNKSGVESVRTE